MLESQGNTLVFINLNNMIIVWWGIFLRMYKFAIFSHNLYPVNFCTILVEVVYIQIMLLFTGATPLVIKVYGLHPKHKNRFLNLHNIACMLQCMFMNHKIWKLTMKSLKFLLISLNSGIQED